MAIKSLDGSTATVNLGNVRPPNTFPSGVTTPHPAGYVAIWIKVDAWTSADQEVMSWRLPDGNATDTPLLDMWALRRVGSTDALQVVHTPTSGTVQGPMVLGDAGAIAGTGWHQLILFDFHYAWDGTVYNSGGTYAPSIGNANAYNIPGETIQELKLYVTPDLWLSELAVGKEVAHPSGTLLTAQQAVATALHTFGKAAAPRGDFYFWAPFDSPRYDIDTTRRRVSSQTSNAGYVYGPPMNAYRDAICTESSMVAYLPLADPAPIPGNPYLDICRNLGDSPRGIASVGAYQGYNPPTAVIEGCTSFYSDYNPVSLLPDANLTLAGPLSLEAWVSPSNAYQNTINRIIAQRSADTSVSPYYDYALSIGSDRKIRFQVSIGSTPYECVSATALATFTWHHVVGVYDGSAIRIYIDGVADGTPVAVSGTVRSTGSGLTIGGPGSSYIDSQEFTGQLSSVAVYNGALDSTQVANHFAAAGTDPPTGPSGEVGPARVTQVAVEALTQGSGRAVVTQLAGEVLYTGTGPARVTQLAVEVLYSNMFGTDYSVSGSSTLDLHAVAARIPGNDYARSASSTLNVHPAASESYSVSRPVSATSSFGVQVRALETTGGPKFVSATSRIALAASGRDPDNPDVLVSATSRINLSGSGVVAGDRNVSATTAFQVTDRALEIAAGTRFVDASTTLVVTPKAKGFIPQARAVAATSTVKVADTNAVKSSAIRVSATSRAFRISTATFQDTDLVLAPSVRDTFSIHTRAVAGLNRSLRVSATTSMGLAASGDSDAEGTRSAMNSLGFSATARANRDIGVSATTSVGLGLGDHVAPLIPESASGSFALHSEALAIDVPLGGVSSLRVLDAADATVSLPAGGGIPGASRFEAAVSRLTAPTTGSGLRSLIRISQPTPAVAGPHQSFRAIRSDSAPTGGLPTLVRGETSGDWPDSFAETPNGLILIANGVDPMLRWDSLSGIADTAGVRPPARNPDLGGVGVGTIVGHRLAYQRFIDQFGNPSILSPVSNEVDFGRDGLIDAVTFDPQTGLVTVHSQAHGLSTGEAVIVSGVEGLPLAGTYVLGATTADAFALQGVTITSGKYIGGGTWTYGMARVVYSNLEAPTEPKVVRRQLLRNLAGNGEVFYVDVDTDDLASDAFISTLPDEILAANEAVPLLDDSDLPHANRHYPPPSTKRAVAAHMGRIFAAGEVTIDAGAIVVSFGSTTVEGVGTNFRPSLVGRSLFIPGASRSYEVAGVDPDAQSIELTAPIADGLIGQQSYAIRPPLGERKFVYYSEPNLPESWPPWNAIAVPEDGDSITGLMVKDSFLYILEERHIYKYTLQKDPARDGFLFLSTRRGCLNDRCHAQVEGVAYMLDDVGIHAFDGSQSRAISTPIQPLFQKGVGLEGMEVNWDADRRLWHAAADPVRETVRWFISMTGTLHPRHAICYDYRRDRWWIEEYPFPMTSSVISTIGHRRSLVGSDAGRVVCLSEGTLDLADPAVGGLASVTSAGPLSLVDSVRTFRPDLVGATVSIARGKGRGQQRRITGSGAHRLDIDRPWRVIPDASSEYQVGGVHWSWRSGWFRVSQSEDERPRDVEVVFQPVKKPASMALELYYDHSEGPREWAYSQEQDGVATRDGSSLIQINPTRPSGYVIQRLSGHGSPYADGDYFVSAKLSGVQGPEPARVYEITLNGARR